MELNIAAWNIGGGITGDSHQVNGCPNLPYYADVLRKYLPDLVCLQEAHHYYDESNQTADLASILGYQYSHSMPISPSHLESHAQLSLGLLSKFPIKTACYTQFINPGLSAIGPSGDVWNLFDKGFCTYSLEFGDRIISVINAHCFPLHYFSASATEERFIHLWDALALGLKAARFDSPCLAAIDLNFSAIELLIGSELDQGKYINAFTAPTTPKGIQQDFLLYTMDSFQLIAVSVIPLLSDHHLCIANYQY